MLCYVKSAGLHILETNAKHWNKQYFFQLVTSVRWGRGRNKHDPEVTLHQPLAGPSQSSISKMI